MISLKKDSIINDGLVGFAMIATGLAFIFSSNKIFAVVMLCISIFAEVIPHLLVIKKQKDIFDELARTNQDKAARSAFDVTTVLLLILSVFLLISSRSITIRFEHVWMVFGLLKIIRCAFFCLYESSGE